MPRPLGGPGGATGTPPGIPRPGAPGAISGPGEPGIGGAPAGAPPPCAAMTTGAKAGPSSVSSAPATVGSATATERACLAGGERRGHVHHHLVGRQCACAIRARGHERRWLVVVLVVVGIAPLSLIVIAGRRWRGRRAGRRCGRCGRCRGGHGRRRCRWRGRRCRHAPWIDGSAVPVTGRRCRARRAARRHCGACGWRLGERPSGRRAARAEGVATRGRADGGRVHGLCSCWEGEGSLVDLCKDAGIALGLGLADDELVGLDGDVALVVPVWRKRAGEHGRRDGTAAPFSSPAAITASSTTIAAFTSVLVAASASAAVVIASA